MIDGAKLWLIGCGNMGGAMLRGWIEGGMAPEAVTVVDRGRPSLPEGVRLLEATPPDGPGPHLLVLAIKPQQLDGIVAALAPRLSADTLLVSVLAGVEIASLRRRFPTPKTIVRAMPNLPAAIGRGVTALYADGAAEDDRARVSALMAAIGATEWITEERLFDAVTAVSGCGPAFLFRFVEALAAGGAALGLPGDQALRLALATVEGSARMAALDIDGPGALADRVASPGGSTREGLNVLDQGGALVDLVAAAVAAAAQRNAELARSAR